ncbi:MAG TPA: hypothetical protein VEA63_08355, partial [Opitutus sp.]|nr:hypothetical protein [Opitutus sp.]
MNLRAILRVGVAARGLALLLALAAACVAAEEKNTREIDGETWATTELVRERFEDDRWRKRWKLEG